MILWPAVDIRDGHAVRLARGEFDAETVYDADPLDAARRWLDDGARALHVVDLDGARSGHPANLEHVRRIVDLAEVPVEVGGGLRDANAVAAVLDAGAERAILGTAALRDPTFAETMVAAHGSERIVVSVDVRDGHVATAGWIEQTDLTTQTALAILRERGVTEFVLSCIDRDGTLGSPDILELGRACDVVPDCAVVYSGGVTTIDDLARLAGLGFPPLRGVIVGTALFERRLTVADGQAELDARAAR